MSLTNLTTKTSYAGNGVTTVFPFTFKVFQATDLVVTETTAAGVTTTLVLNTDYTVTGAGLDAGGSITRLGATSPPPTGTTGLIRRVMPLTQTADIRNQSAFYASVHEDVFDKLTMVDQQQEEEIGRSLQIPEEFSSGVSNQLPAPAASTVIGWNAAGTGLANFLIPGVTPTYVVTFNGRSGAVVPAANDYSFAQISGAATSAQINAALTTPGPIGGTTAAAVTGTTITANTQFTGPGTGLTGTAASLTAGHVTTNANLTGDVTSVGNATTLSNTAVTPGSYTSANITVDSKGRVTAAANGSGGGGAAIERIENGIFYGGASPWNMSGTTPPAYDSANTHTTNSGAGGISSSSTFGVSTTSTGSLSQVLRLPTPGGAVTLNFWTFQKVTNAAAISSGYVKVYVLSPGGTETLAATITLTNSSSTTGAWTSRSVTLTSTITTSGAWGLRLELQNVNDYTSGVSGSNTAILDVDDISLVL